MLIVAYMTCHCQEEKMSEAITAKRPVQARGA
jgi:hypothetical protein